MFHGITLLRNTLKVLYHIFVNFIKLSKIQNMQKYVSEDVYPLNPHFLKIIFK
jgi:hypothetical protein